MEVEIRFGEIMQTNVDESGHYEERVIVLGTISGSWLYIVLGEYNLKFTIAVYR